MTDQLQKHLTSERERLAVEVESLRAQLEDRQKDLEAVERILGKFVKKEETSLANTTPQSVAHAIRQLIERLGNNPFTAYDIDGLMKKYYPTVQYKNGYLGGLLWRFADEGDLRIVRKGTPRNPPLYCRNESQKTVEHTSVTGSKETVA